MSWNGSNGASAPKQKPVNGARAVSKGAIAGVIVVLGAAAALYFLMPASAPTPKASAPKEKSTAIAEVAPAEAGPAEVEVEEAPVKKIDPEKAARAAKLKAMSPEERLEFLFEEAKKKPIDFTTTTNRPFATGTEQVMSWIFTTRVGNMPPPMPKMSIRDEAHLAEILMADNPILEGDSENVQIAKEAVELAKKEAIEFVKQGGDVQEFLEYYRGVLVEAHQEWQASQKAVMQVIREEPELAADYIETVNKRLAEKGIKPVNIPPKFKEELGLE